MRTLKTDLAWFLSAAAGFTVMTLAAAAPPSAAPPSAAPAAPIPAPLTAPLPTPAPPTPLTMSVDGVSRVYFLHTPPAYRAGHPLPLMLLLHGRGGSPLETEEYTGMDKKADAAPFLLACPAALGDIPTWSVGLNSGMKDPSDVHFLGALIDRLEKDYSVDPARVYVVGHSSGAMMAYRLAAELSGKIAAIGVVAGTVGARDAAGRWTLLPRPDHPVSVILFHGTADPTMPYATGDKNAYNSNFLGAADSAAFWARADGCKMTPRRVSLEHGAVSRDTYSGGRDGAEVVLYSIVGGDHWWPGDKLDAPYVAPADQAVSATDLICDFLARHPRPPGH